MNENAVAKLALELDKQLAEHRSLTAADREALEDLRRDIRNLLDAPDPSTDRHAAVLEKLRSATARFERSHPSLTVVMGQVITTLSNMGI